MKPDDKNKQHKNTGSGASNSAMKNPAPLNGTEQTKKKQHGKGTLEDDFGKGFLNEPGDPETAQEGLI